MVLSEWGHRTVEDVDGLLLGLCGYLLLFLLSFNNIVARGVEY